MANCPGCNEGNPDTAKFCLHCGRLLAGNSYAPPAAGVALPAGVILADIRMPFTRMVEVTFKWTFAAMLVGVCFGAVYFFLWALWMNL